MTDILTQITTVAVSVFRDKMSTPISEQNYYDAFQNYDIILRTSQQASLLTPKSQEDISKIVDLILTDDNLSILAPREGELDPMLLHPGGGFRISPSGIITSLFSSALLQMYFLRLPQDESIYVRTVIEGYEELKRAVKGEKIRAYAIDGVSGVFLQDETNITTPWGTIRQAPSVSEVHVIQRFDQPKTSCIITNEHLVQVRFDRAPNPENTFDESERIPQCTNNLLQLSCALATNNLPKPAIPLMNWSTLLMPFQSGFSYSSSLLRSRFGKEINLGLQKAEIEEMARTINTVHVPSIDIAAERLVSAIAHRSDKRDSLIDAVMVWENLLGTSSEVTYRVSASLAKLLENNTEDRKALRKQLSGIYGIRSRLIHGSVVDESKINEACETAIDTALKALRISYSKGHGWLSMNSNERSDHVLLE